MDENRCTNCIIRVANYFFVAYRNGCKPMHKRGKIRYANYTVCASVFIHFCMQHYANYTVCASVFIHFCMQRKNNENIPILCPICITFVECTNVYAYTTIYETVVLVM